MAVQPGTFSTDSNVERERNILGTEPIRLILTFDDE